MTNFNQLSEEDLKKVTGGARGDVPISDSIIQELLGYTWEGLAFVLNPFLQYAEERSYTSYVNEIKGLLESKVINAYKIISYFTSLNALRPVAESGGFNDVVIIIDKLLSVLKNFS